MNTRIAYRFALVALTLLLNATHSVLASETAWQEVAPGAQLRLISSNNVSEQGNVEAALQIRMAPGLKTYWRVPGETGIPLSANWQGSKNVETGTFKWPFPKRVLDYGVMDYVLEGDITVPLNIALTDQNSNALLVAELNLGICSDICVPVRWNGELDINLNNPSSSNAFRIRAALAQVPVLDQRENAPFQQVGYDAENNQLILLQAPDQVANLSLIVDLPKTTLLFDMPHSGPESRVMTVATLTDFDLSTLVDQEIRLTYDSADGPFTKLVIVEALHRVDGASFFE